MKKLISAVLCISMLMTCSAHAQYTDVDAQNEFKTAIDNLTVYGVMSGNGDGTFEPSGNVTRAQFAKIAVKLSGEEVLMTNGGLFSDTPEGYWANGYIATAAKRGYIYGYPDGSFHPEENITFAQGITILLRVLGYGTAQLGNDYPGAYIKKAKELNITDGIAFNPDDILTRQLTAQLTDKMLMCDMYTQSEKKSKLITKLDYSASDECIILGTGKTNSDILSDEVVTSIGTYKNKMSGIEEFNTNTVKLVLNADNEIINVVKTEKIFEKCTVDTLNGNEMTYKSGGTSHTIYIDDNAVIYYNLSKSKFRDIAENIESGMLFTIYYTDGKYDYGILNDKKLDGPKVLYDKTSVSSLWNINASTEIIRDGEKQSADSLEAYDVLYYDENLNTIYAYCDKKSGIYEDAYPTKAQAKSVKLSGTVYELETKAAANVLAGSNCEYNDYITLLLGKDGKVAAVITSEKIGTEYGVLLSCDKCTDEGTSKYYAKIMGSDGNVTEYVTDKNYDSLRGKVCSMTFSNGIMKPSVISTSDNIRGNVDKELKTIDNKYLAPNVKLIDVTYVPELSETSAAEAYSILFSDIPQNSLSASDVLFSKTDKNGRITFIALNNVTNKGYKFGIVTDVKKLSSSCTYTIDTDGTKNTYNMTGVAKPTKGQPVMASIRDGKLLRITVLNSVANGKNVNELTKSAITLNGKEYPLADGATVYSKSDISEYNAIDIDDVKISDISSAELFSEKSISGGGKIRIIKITLK